MLIRKLPAICSLLALAGPVTDGLAQAPLQPPSARPTAMGLYAQAAPAVPPATPAATDATPAPLTPLADPNTPAPIAPPPATLNGQPGAPVVPGQPLPPPVDTAAPTSATNAAGARAREFQGDDVGQVLRLLARQAKISIIVSPLVVGTISMRLEDVTALQAIETICQAQGYDLTDLKGVYYVKTPAEKAAEPTQSDFYTFSYARAATVAPLLAGQLKSKAGAPQVDERTNTLFYQEAKSNLSSIREFLARVDRPTRQVMIEARLVEVNSNPVQSYGINWAGVVGSSASPKTFQYGGSGLASYAPVQATNPATGLPSSTITQSTLPTVNTVTSGASSVLSPFDFLRNGQTGSNFLGNLGQQFAILDIPSFSATVRFLNEDADAEFLANPRIVTADNLEATIKIVRNQPVPQLNFNEQTATAVFGGFQDKIFGSTLIVKPSINKDNFITMSVKPEISNRVGDQVFNFAGAQVSSPIIDTRTLEANVPHQERLHAGHRRPVAGSGDQGRDQGADPRRHPDHRLPVPGASQHPRQARPAHLRDPDDHQPDLRHGPGRSDHRSQKHQSAHRVRRPQRLAQQRQGRLAPQEARRYAARRTVPRAGRLQPEGVLQGNRHGAQQLSGASRQTLRDSSRPGAGGASPGSGPQRFWEVGVPARI